MNEFCNFVSKKIKKTRKQEKKEKKCLLDFKEIELTENEIKRRKDRQTDLQVCSN